jgi:hypothetical protein
MAYSKVKLETMAVFDSSEYEMFPTEICCKTGLKYHLHISFCGCYDHSVSDQDVPLSAVHVLFHVVNA